MKTLKEVKSEISTEILKKEELLEDSLFKETISNSFLNQVNVIISRFLKDGSLLDFVNCDSCGKFESKKIYISSKCPNVFCNNDGVLFDFANISPDDDVEHFADYLGKITNILTVRKTTDEYAIIDVVSVNVSFFLQ